MLDVIRGAQGQATASRFGTVEKASSTEGSGGTENVRYMTSLRTLNLIRNANSGASESNRGTATISSNTQIDAGTSNTVIVSPQKLERRLTDVVNRVNTSTPNKVRYLTQNQYDNLGTYDNDTFYETPT